MLSLLVGLSLVFAYYMIAWLSTLAEFESVSS